MPNPSRTFFNISPHLFLLIAIIASQYFYDVQKKERPDIPPTIIPAQALKLGDLGLHSAAAALMWVYTIQQTTANADKLPEMIKNINDIDPKFSYPYAFAALVLPSFNYPGFGDQAIQIGNYGISNADPDWRIPYYLATSYHIVFKDREKAAYYFDIASRTEGAPDKIKQISSIYGTAPNVREQTKQIWISLYDNSNDEIVKERAKKYIDQITLLDILDQAVIIYKQRYGKLPKKIEDLVSGRILKEVPEDPLGPNFYIDPTGRIR